MAQETLQVLIFFYRTGLSFAVSSVTKGSFTRQTRNRPILLYT